MSDTSQGEGWWIASDGKWYAPEQHPDYVAPSDPVRPQGAPDFAAETVAIPAASDPVAPDQPPTPPAASETVSIPAAQPVMPTEPANPASRTTAGPSFIPPGPPTETYNPAGTSISSDPNYNLPESDSGSGSKRNLLLGVGALVLVAGLGFLAFRFFTGGSAAGGADSPEAAVGQLIASINERDAVGFVDVFDPDEIDAWFGSFAPAISQFDDIEESGEQSNEIADVYESVFEAFDYTISGPGDEPIAYQSEPLDDNGRITRVRVEAVDFEIMIEDVDSAVVVALGDEPVGLDVTEVDGTRVELRDERGGLASRLIVPGESPVDEFSAGGHLDLVTVQKNGKWYVSIGYSFLEIARNTGEFDGFPSPDFGRAYELVDSQAGGSDSPEGAVRDLFTALETLDYETMIELTDPFATPYLHDYQPLIDSQVDQGARQDFVRDTQLRFDELELGVSEWEGRTLVTTNDITADAVDNTRFTLDTVNWCASYQDDFGSDRACLEDGIAELLFELDSDLNPRDFIPDQAGFVVVERNGRWYVDPLGTFGFYADQIAEIGVDLTDDFEGNPTTELGDFFVAEGPIARQDVPATTQAESGSAAIAVDVSDFPVVGDGFDDYHVAVARVVTDAPGSFVSYDPVPLTGEDWVVVFDSTFEDAELPAIAVSTNGVLDVQLVEAPVVEVGIDGYSGQLGGEGRPQIFTFTAEAANADVSVEGAFGEDVRSWERQGVVLDRVPFNSFVGNGVFTVVYGDPGASFDIVVTPFVPEPTPTPEATPEPVPTPEPFDPVDPEDPIDGFDDVIVTAFGNLVEGGGFDYSFEQFGGFFDGCNGPEDPDVTTYVWEDFNTGSSMLLTVYPNEQRAQAAFDAMFDIASPCPAFPDIEIVDVTAVSDIDVLITWQLTGDPETLTYEQYRLSGDTIVAATDFTLADLEDQLFLLDIWG